jgi:hypothetical protein
MSDLISRKAVIDIINKHRCDTNRIEENVLNLPTAYDVDEVVEQFEKEKRFWEERSIVPIINLDKAISIVKGAVKDE